MIQFFQNILNLLSILVNFIISMFADLMYLISLAPKIFGAVTSLFSTLPPYFSTPFMALFGVSFVVTIFHLWGNAK